MLIVYDEIKYYESKSCECQLRMYTDYAIDNNE